MSKAAVVRGQSPVPAQGVRRWVVCADDFAIDEGADEAIISLIGMGRLSASSALVDSALWRRSAPQLAQLGGRADIGLHLNLTQDLGQGASTVWGLAELIVRSRVGLIDAIAVRTAIERQLDRFEEGLGRQPDYIDGHQHVHQFPIVRRELLQLICRRYGKSLPWIRSTRSPAGVFDRKARTIAALGERRLREDAAHVGAGVSQCLLGVYDFAADRAAYLRHLETWMGAGPDGSVLMCHPATKGAKDDPIAAARTMEYEILASDVFPALLKKAKIQTERGSRLFAVASRSASVQAR